MDDQQQVDTQGLGPGSELFKMAAATVSAGLSPQEKAEVPVQFAAQSKIKAEASQGMDSRMQLYSALQNKNSLIDQKQAELLDQMSTNKPLSKSQVAAMMLIGIMPTLVGGIVNGKRGISQGAEAGSLGVQTAVKGFQAQNAQDATQAQLEYKSLDKTKQANNNQANDLLSDEFKSQDMNARTNANNAAKIQAAGIRASGDLAGLKTIKAGLDNLAASYRTEKLGREVSSITQPLVVNDTAFIPTQSVDKEKSDKLRIVASKYDSALDNIQAIAEMSAGMDFATFERIIGDKSSDMHQKYSFAQNAIFDAKKVAGLKGTDAVKNLDKFLANPTSLWANLKALAPGTATVEQQTNNAFGNIQRDVQSLLELNGFRKYAVGDLLEVTVDGKPTRVRIGKINPDGSFEPLEE